MSEGFLLSHVVNQGDLAATQALLGEACIDVNSLNAAGESALHVAIRRCLPSMVELLLRFGASPQIPSDAKCGAQTPLHLCAELDQASVMAMLLSFGANPNVVDAQKQTALHIAARLGHISSARVLIAHGSSLIAEDGLGRTPLRLAEGSMKCSESHAEIVQALLAAIKDTHGASYVDEKGLKVDEKAVAAAGGPMTVLASGQPIKVSGVSIVPSSQFCAEARQYDSHHIAWVNNALRKKEKKR